jgi:hypothetical protein
MPIDEIAARAERKPWTYPYTADEIEAIAIGIVLNRATNPAPYTWSFEARNIALRRIAMDYAAALRSANVTADGDTRAQRAEVVDRFLRHAAEPSGEYRFRLSPTEYQALAIALRSRPKVAWRADSLIRQAAESVDWQQVVGNGGPPCFMVEHGRFCLRSERWDGHPKVHSFISLASMLDGYVVAVALRSADSPEAPEASAVTHTADMGAGPSVSGATGPLSEHAADRSASGTFPRTFGHDLAANASRRLAQRPDVVGHIDALNQAEDDAKRQTHAEIGKQLHQTLPEPYATAWRYHVICRLLSERDRPARATPALTALLDEVSRLTALGREIDELDRGLIEATLLMFRAVEWESPETSVKSVAADLAAALMAEPGEPTGDVAAGGEYRDMNVMAPVPPDSPLLIAWELYSATEAYANTRRWALHDQHVDGSLWAAFHEGWRCHGVHVEDCAGQGSSTAKGDTFQSAQSGNVMDPATWEYIPDPFTTELDTNVVDADPDFVPTRGPATDEPAFNLITKAAVTVSRLTAERDTLADQRERQAEYIERLEKRLSELEGGE